MIKVVTNHGRQLEEGFTSAIVNGVFAIRKKVVVNDEARSVNVLSFVIAASFVINAGPARTHSYFVIPLASA
jgi:hypothetical protein